MSLWGNYVQPLFKFSVRHDLYVTHVHVPDEIMEIIMTWRPTHCEHDFWWIRAIQCILCSIDESLTEVFGGCYGFSRRINYELSLRGLWEFTQKISTVAWLQWDLHPPSLTLNLIRCHLPFLTWAQEIRNCTNWKYLKKRKDVIIISKMKLSTPTSATYRCTQKAIFQFTSSAQNYCDLKFDMNLHFTI